jgi:large subunit ribosomal protein L15
MKLKKGKKSVRMRGKRTHGHSAKLNKGKGSRGGKGMSGSGKRADQKKTLVLKKYGKNYFGKQGITSKKTAKKKIKLMNLRDIEKKYEGGEIDLKEYKILGDGEIKKKFIIKAKAASKSAVDKIKKAGGEIIIEKKKIKKKVEKKSEKKENLKKVKVKEEKEKSEKEKVDKKQ